METAAPARSTAPAQGAATLLDVKNLRVTFATRDGDVDIVRDISLSLNEGEILGLVGESGSGKSMTAFALLGLVDAPGKISGDTIRFGATDLSKLTDQQYRAFRGGPLAMIFQDPMMTLNPLLRIDTQMIETVRAHQPGVGKNDARALAAETLRRVGIPAPEARLRTYPHELSGGMRQRVAIAIALLNRPKLIIADEPTTALDVTIQEQILYEIRKLCKESKTALIWITHDLAVVSGLADRLAVMYAGKIVETGTTAELVQGAMHPYTHGLIASIPTLATRGQTLARIPGTTPSPNRLPSGCPFRDRCYKATEQCRQVPPEEPFSNTHWARCWHPGRDTR
jgi:peptide/nickel transport system ATP-binding protein